MNPACFDLLPASQDEKDMNEEDTANLITIPIK